LGSLDWLDLPEVTMSENKSLSLREKIALGSSTVIIVGAVIYWGFQVQNVMELLELAYG
jgi:hypothetical protein|tara:strand:- start:2980 stop:3156 length:177 start_codon:yes stop_codon:yes gene_type:complete